MSPFDGLGACAARRAAADAMVDEATDGDHSAHVGTENSKQFLGNRRLPVGMGTIDATVHLPESNANAAVAAFAAMVAQFNSHTGPLIAHLHSSTGLSESRRWTCRLFTACTTLVASSRTWELLRTQQRTSPNDIQSTWDRSPKWSQFRSPGRQRAGGCGEYGSVGAYASIARHAAKNAESNRTRNEAWQSWVRTGRPGVRAG